LVRIRIIHTYNLKVTNKFGYSLETFRLSALASLYSSKIEIQRNLDTKKVCVRIFGSDNQQAKDEFSNVLSEIGKQYCFEENPECEKCPLSMICDFKLTKTVCDHESKNIESQCLQFADLFCGAGGLSTGLKSAGLQPVWAVDIDPASVITYKHNHISSNAVKVYCGDAAEILKLNDKKLLKTSIDVLCGGPPCQGFSNANRQRLSDDPRNNLYKIFLTTLQTTSAKYAILENVPGMKKAAPSIINEFNEIGYKTKLFEVEASEYGVAQKRKRLFVIAKKITHEQHDTNFFLKFKETLNMLKINGLSNITDAISDLPNIDAKNIPNSTNLEGKKFGFSCWISELNTSSKTKVLFNHRSKYLNNRDNSIYSKLAPGEDSGAEAIREINPYKNRSHIFKDKFYRLRPDHPAKTITAHMYYDTHMYIHPNQARGLSPREAARIQGFSDDFIFFGYPNEWYRQIGNAVSPTVAKAIGIALKAADEAINV
jgi:DNA (cytosine-5)-methyltransferase 1